MVKSYLYAAEISDPWFLYLSYRRERKSKYVHCSLLCPADLGADYRSRKVATRNLH